MNLLRRLLDTPAAADLALLAGGRLYLRRAPTLPKGARECLISDALAVVRQTGVAHTYQLVVRRGHAAEEDGADESDLDGESSGVLDEYVFTIDETLGVRVLLRGGVITWRDRDGDAGDCFEFDPDSHVPLEAVAGFVESVYRATFEHKYGCSASTAQAADLDEFVAGEEFQDAE